MRFEDKLKLISYIIAVSYFDRLSNDFVLPVPGALQPWPHSHIGYWGPWIENYFYLYCLLHQKELSGANKINRIYIPIFWTDYYLECHKRRTHPEIQEFLDQSIDPDKKYFTIVQNAEGIHESIPGNVLIFSAGGVGDIPIPLLKENLKPVRRKRDILCSFMGRLEGRAILTDIRSKGMHEVLKDKQGFYFGAGTMREYIDIMSRSVFALCPRGWGRTSFRLYEAMALGAIPVYIWDDVEWLPYKDSLRWDEFSISINVKDVYKLPDIIAAHTPEDIKRKQRKIKELHDEYFTYEGTCRQILRMLR